MKNFLNVTIFVFLCYLLLLSKAIAEEPKLINLTIDKGADHASLLFTVSAAQGYKVFTLQHPNRLVVDLQDAHLRTNPSKINFAGTPILKVRHGRFNAHTFRVVFDLRSSVRFRAQMRAQAKGKSLLVIDIYYYPRQIIPTTKIIPEISKTPETTKEPEPKKLPKTIQPNQNNETLKLKSKSAELKTTPVPQLQVSKTFKPRKMIIIIDPGHGGKDPGTIGRKGTKEKDVVLSIGKQLAELINLEPNMQAILTRKSDYFVPLRGRLDIARKNKGDLFISIHADSFYNNQLVGASIYALSQHGATTEAARWIAKRENYSELGGVYLNGLEDKSYVLRSVLIDLSQTATINDSLQLGSIILETLKNVTTLHYTRVEQAPFMVLKSPDIPSILVETGFLSNPAEEERLRQAAYRDKLARAILSGVRLYVTTHPMMANPVS